MDMKKCDHCRKELPKINFGNKSRSKDGLNPTCKECKREFDKRYWKDNKDILNIKQKEFYSCNKEKICNRVKAFVKKNQQRHNGWSTNAKRRLKIEVFSHYCSGQIRCAFCPEYDVGLLTMDHIKGGGNKHREKMKIKTGYSTYQWLKKNNYPEGFQVLCWNCQYRKRQQETSPSNPTKRQMQKASYIQSLKLQCLSEYGEICPCGESDLVVLTLDHVNDDGAKHRKETGTKGTAFYLHLRSNGFPNDPPLQVLCIKCQYRKINEKRKIRPATDSKDAAIVV